jgi:hypothetical protein
LDALKIVDSGIQLATEAHDAILARQPDERPLPALRIEDGDRRPCRQQGLIFFSNVFGREVLSHPAIGGVLVRVKTFLQILQAEAGTSLL